MKWVLFKTNDVFSLSWVMVQVKNLSLRLEHESHKRSLAQSELKMQNQQVLVLCSSEKQLKQELNHLLDTKQTMDKQNQELRRLKPNELIQHAVTLRKALRLSG